MTKSLKAHEDEPLNAKLPLLMTYLVKMVEQKAMITDRVQIGLSLSLAITHFYLSNSILVGTALLYMTGEWFVMLLLAIYLEATLPSSLGINKSIVQDDYRSQPYKTFLFNIYRTHRCQEKSFISFPLDYEGCLWQEEADSSVGS